MRDIFHYSPHVTRNKHNYTSILKIQQSLEIRVYGLLVQTHETRYLNHVRCLNILNRLLYC